MKQVLFLSPLPPPFYGSAMSSAMCLDILNQSEEFAVSSIKLNFAQEIDEMGRISAAGMMHVLNARKSILKSIRSSKPDLIYIMPATSHWGFLRDYLLSRTVSRRTNCPVVFHLRSHILERSWKNRFQRKMFQRMYSGNNVILIDESSRKELRDMVREEDIYVLPNAIENEVEEEEFERMFSRRRGREDFFVLFLANMMKTKGWPKLLEACRLLNEKGIDFKCTFVGAWMNERDREEFEENVASYGLSEKVMSLGHKKGVEKNRIMASSDVMVFPTEYPHEAFPRVVLEGMMFGLPVIANDWAAIPNMIEHGRSGFILKENSPQEIMSSLMKVKDDRELREELGRAGRKKFLECYEREGYGTRFLELLKDIS
ncbi:glycosyltransferase family 4 protein [Acidobacteriota bacterium]